MLDTLLKRFFGSRNERLVGKYKQKARQINDLEPALQALSDSELQAKTAEFKDRLAKGETLDALLPEAFAVVREASQRVLGMRHFDMQLVGGMVLHEGKIAEMRTGEGKTLVATLPAYLNALSGQGVHVVTVNDYLAKRDAEWMGRLYGFLGLTVGTNLSQMDYPAKQEAYRADITYGTNSEFGFDYLRDNMATTAEERLQRPLHFAIVDEVDSILIDEARTPLIISGQADGGIEIYDKINLLVPQLERQEKEDGPGDYSVDEKQMQVLLTEAGHIKAEELLTAAGLLAEGDSLYSAANITLMHHLYACLRASALFHRDQHYVVQGGEIVIVDEFTGRLQPGRRWSDGLHQAIEAKEGVTINRENQTLASITYQNFFRMFKKLAGMTGTADTEAYEFQQIYSLETVVIPTNKPMQRIDAHDQVFRSKREKHAAILADIQTRHANGQPILVGTLTIENSEELSELLNGAKLKHQVLNAKQHASEADIVAQAGRPGVITIATNMAGRGTDIVLGGNISKDIEAIRQNEALSSLERDHQIKALQLAWQAQHEQVLAAGGLHIIGTERAESRRVDNQLRGRSGRQGDPGSSRFYLSLEDPLLRIFASDRVAAIMDRLKMPDGEAIEHPWVSRSIENAQRKVEARNFDIRKQLLEYDDVANEQRKAIYAQRNELLDSTDVSETINDMRNSLIREVVEMYIPPNSLEEQWDVPTLEATLLDQFGFEGGVPAMIQANPNIAEHEITDRVVELANQAAAKREADLGAPLLRHLERAVLLQTLDTRWREHLSALDHLRQGIHLRGFAQKNPKQEYKREAFELFSQLLDTIKREAVQLVMTIQVRSESDVAQVEQPSGVSNVRYVHADYDEALAAAEEETPAPLPDQYQDARIGRNDPCPCGSGKKYKLCHGKLV